MVWMAHLFHFKANLMLIQSSSLSQKYIPKDTRNAGQENTLGKPRSSPLIAWGSEGEACDFWLWMNGIINKRWHTIGFSQWANLENIRRKNFLYCSQLHIWIFLLNLFSSEHFKRKLFHHFLYNSLQCWVVSTASSHSLPLSASPPLHFWMFFLINQTLEF